MSDPWAEFGAAPAAVAPPPPAAHDWSEFSAADAPPSTAEDVAKSAGTGLVKGTTALAGAPGMVADAIGNGAEWAIQRGLKAVGLVPQGVEPQGLGEITADNAALNRGTNTLPRTEDMNRVLQHQAGQFYQPQTTAGKYAETAAEFVPSSIAMPGSVPANLAKGAISGLASEAAGQATKGTALEGPARIAAAVAAPGALSRAVTPLPINAERAAMVDTLRQEGVPLTAGQVTGSKGLRYAESAASEMPVVGARLNELDDVQKRAFAKAALTRIGIDADAATPEVLRGAKAAIGKQFDDLAKNNTATFDPQFGHDIGKVLNDYDGMVLPNQQAPIVQKTIDGIAAEGGSMPGVKYQAVRSNLDKGARSIAQSNPPLSQALFGIRNALDSAMERSIRPEDAGAWSDARGAWKNYKVLEKVAGGAGENAAAGAVSPAALRSAASAQNRGAYATGHGDFAELARSGVGVMSPLPNSGTAGRSFYQHMFAPGAMAGGGLGMMLGGGEAATLGAMAGAAAPPILARVLASRPGQAYLGNQILGEAPTGSRFLDQLLAANAAYRSLPAPRAE